MQTAELFWGGGLGGNQYHKPQTIRELGCIAFVCMCLCGRGLAKVRCDTVSQSADLSRLSLLLSNEANRGRAREERSEQQKSYNRGKRAEDTRGEKTMKEISTEQKWRVGFTCSLISAC